MNDAEKNKMTYVPHRVSKKQEFVMQASTEMQKNKRAYGDHLLALRGVTRDESTNILAHSFGGSARL